jgi:hypothetical protein
MSGHSVFATHRSSLDVDPMVSFSLSTGADSRAGDVPYDAVTADNGTAPSARPEARNRHVPT